MARYLGRFRLQALAMVRCSPSPRFWMWVTQSNQRYFVDCRYFQPEIAVRLKKTVLGSMNAAKPQKLLTDRFIQSMKLMMQCDHQKNISSYDLSVQNLPQILLSNPKLGNLLSSSSTKPVIL